MEVRVTRAERTPIWLSWSLTGLAAGLGIGAAGATFSRLASGQGPPSNVFLSESNIRRIVSKLSRMRGAALKLGQFLSIQGTEAVSEVTA